MKPGIHDLRKYIYLYKPLNVFVTRHLNVTPNLSRDEIGVLIGVLLGKKGFYQITKLKKEVLLNLFKKL